MAKTKKDPKAAPAGQSVLEAILAKHGDVARLGATVSQVDVIPTGSTGLDTALGTGGLPRGRIVEIYGPESSGKTTLTLHVVAQAQAMGLRCAFVDAEHAMDAQYAAALGVHLDRLYLVQPDSGEQALDIVTMLAGSGEVGLVVVDSVAALTPQAELDGEIGDSHVGLQARMMGQAMRKMCGSAAQTNTLVIFINQLRMKIGVMYGSPETTPGGNALKYYASVRLDIRRIGKIQPGGKDGPTTGQRTRVKVVKNKCAPPHREAEFDIAFGVGIDRAAELVELALTTGHLVLSGSWVSWGPVGQREGTKVAQGRASAIQAIRADQTALDELTAAVRGSK